MAAPVMVIPTGQAICPAEAPELSAHMGPAEKDDLHNRRRGQWNWRIRRRSGFVLLLEGSCRGPGSLGGSRERDSRHARVDRPHAWRVAAHAPCPAVDHRLLSSPGHSFVTIPQMFDLPSPTIGWAPRSNPDVSPAVELAASDPRPSWNASPTNDASGHLHLAYETPAGIVYGDNVSGSWRPETVAASTSSTFVSRPSIAVDPDGGTHLAVLDGSPIVTFSRIAEPGGTSRIWLARSPS